MIIQAFCLVLTCDRSAQTMLTALARKTDRKFPSARFVQDPLPTLIPCFASPTFPLYCSFLPCAFYVFRFVLSLALFIFLLPGQL